MFLASLKFSCRKIGVLGRTVIKKSSTLWQSLFQPFSLATLPLLTKVRKKELWKQLSASFKVRFNRWEGCSGQNIASMQSSLSYSVTRNISDSLLPVWPAAFAAMREGCFFPIAPGSSWNHTPACSTIRPSACGHKGTIITQGTNDFGWN